jgi:2'-hydroxyisoflavone reductase
MEQGMNILILGGGVFLGAAALDAALGAGHRLSVFNRGRARAAWPDAVELLHGDRSGDLAVLRGRRWDAVLDTSGYVPADVAASAAALSDSAAYLFVSSISAYAAFEQAPVREDAALADAAGVDPVDRDLQHYGAQKAACEGEVQRVFGARATIVRPGLIVGPGDRSGRFGYWPWRAAAGGAMLVPAAPADEPLQFIDVRDLGGWLIRLLESGTRGVFNATGPIGPRRCSWPALLDACSAAVSRRGGVPAVPVAVDEGFLLANGVQPWTELPLWLPSGDAAHRGHSRIDVERARAAGLTTRPLEQTIDAVLDEAAPGADDPRRRGKLTAEREAELIARWRLTMPR